MGSKLWVLEVDGAKASHSDPKANRATRHIAHGAFIVRSKDSFFGVIEIHSVSRRSPLVFNYSFVSICVDSTLESLSWLNQHCSANSAETVSDGGMASLIFCGEV